MEIGDSAYRASPWKLSRRALCVVEDDACRDAAVELCILWEMLPENQIVWDHDGFYVPQVEKRSPIKNNNKISRIGGYKEQFKGCRGVVLLPEPSDQTPFTQQRINAFTGRCLWGHSCQTQLGLIHSQSLFLAAGQPEGDVGWALIGAVGRGHFGVVFLWLGHRLMAGRDLEGEQELNHLQQRCSGLMEGFLQLRACYKGYLPPKSSYVWLCLRPVPAVPAAPLSLPHAGLPTALNAPLCHCHPIKHPVLFFPAWRQGILPVLDHCLLQVLSQSIFMGPGRCFIAREVFYCSYLRCM